MLGDCSGVVYQRAERRLVSSMPSNPLPLVGVIVGWPAVMASITLVLIGVIRARSRVALAGAFLGCPFLFYLFASPGVGWLSLIVGVLYLGASHAVAQSRRGLATALATPFVALAGFVAWLVLNQ
jgi:hypothetical protein